MRRFKVKRSQTLSESSQILSSPVNEPTLVNKGGRPKLGSEPVIRLVPRINYALNANLLQEIDNWLKMNYNRGVFHSTSLTGLIKKALTAFQNKEIDLDWNLRPSAKELKKQVTVVWNDPGLFNFYQTLPIKQRTAIIELSLLAYYRRESEGLGENKI